MLNNHYFIWSGCYADPLPQTGGAPPQSARVRPTILLAALTVLAIFGVSNTTGFSAVRSQLVATISPTSVSFGNVPIDTTSPAHTVTLENSGTGTLSITSVTISGTNAAAFSRAGTCGSSLAPKSSCTFSVTFTPNSTGASSATLEIATNAIGGRRGVGLKGAGVAPAITLSPTSLPLGSQPVGTTSAAQTITVENVGNGVLDIANLMITGANAGDFAQTNTCGSSVAAGGSCTISVTFTPTASGSRTASVSITDNASGSPQAVSLTGTGAAPSAGVSPASLTFASQSVGTSSTAQSVTLSNTGSAPLSITGLAIAGTNPGDFTQSNNCGTSVAAGGSCTISVTFKPSAAGTRTAGIIVTDNASGSPQSVSLAGTGGSANAAASLSPTSLSFGSEGVDMVSSSQVVTLSNTGGASLSISGLVFTGANAGDFTEVDTCSPAVPAGGTCTIAILFTPAASGTRTAALSIADNASGSPQSVSLSGSGTHDVMLSWTASATPGVLGYNVYRGTTSGGESSTPLNSTPISSTTFTDVNVTAGSTYYYHVTSVAANNVTQSSASNETGATIPTP